MTITYAALGPFAGGADCVNRTKSRRCETPPTLPSPPLIACGCHQSEGLHPLQRVPRPALPRKETSSARLSTTQTCRMGCLTTRRSQSRRLEMENIAPEPPHLQLPLNRQQTASKDYFFFFSFFIVSLKMSC